MADYPDEQDDGPLAPPGDEGAIAEADAEADLDLESQVTLKQELEEKLKAGKTLTEKEMIQAEKLLGEKILDYLKDSSS